MRRRDFITTTVTGAVAGAAAAGARHALASKQSTGRRFNLKYAPHFGMFAASAGSDQIAQLQFMADQGFMALEDNGMRGRSVADQKRIAAEMDRLGMEMGVFVGHGDFGAVTMASDKSEDRERILKDMRESVETAKRVNAKWCTVVPGAIDPRRDAGYQFSNTVDLLKRCCDIVEPHQRLAVLRLHRQQVALGHRSRSLLVLFFVLPLVGAGRVFDCFAGGANQPYNLVGHVVVVDTVARHGRVKAVAAGVETRPDRPCQRLAVVGRPLPAEIPDGISRERQARRPDIGSGDATFYDTRAVVAVAVHAGELGRVDFKARPRQQCRHLARSPALLVNRLAALLLFAPASHCRIGTQDNQHPAPHHHCQ